MKLLLTSEGFTNAQVVDACVELVGKKKDDITFAVINESYAVEEGDKRWVLRNLNDLANNFSGDIDLVNLLALTKDEVRKRISQRDVIFVVGGNTDYLMHVFNTSGFTDSLTDLLRDKVYVGISAGSMVMGKRISTAAYQEVYGEGNDFGTTKYMNHFNAAIKPHLGREDFPNTREDILTKIASDFDGTIYGLRDGQAIVVNNEKVSFVNGPAFNV